MVYEVVRVAIVVVYHIMSTGRSVGEVLTPGVGKVLTPESLPKEGLEARADAHLKEHR